VSEEKLDEDDDVEARRAIKKEEEEEQEGPAKGTAMTGGGRAEGRRRDEGQEAIGTSDRISLVNQIWPNKRTGQINEEDGDPRTGTRGGPGGTRARGGRRARENSCASCVH